MDAYALDYVDTTFRVRNDLISWDEGIQVVDNARMRIDAHWRALEDVPQDPQQRILFGQIAQARKGADAAAAELRAILVRRDIVALGRFADTRLIPRSIPSPRG